MELPEIGVRERVDGAPIAEELTLRGVTGPGHRHLALRCPHPDDRHLVPGERPGLVRAYDRDRAEGLRCRETADKAVSPHHVLDADGKRQRHDRRKALRDHRHRKRDADEEHLQELPLLQEADADREHSNTDGDDPDVAAEDVHLPRQRRRFGSDPLGEAGDQAELRPHTGGDRDTPPPPVDDRRTRKDHVAPFGKRSFRSERSRRLIDGRGLAGQRGLVHLKRRCLDEREVGGHPVPHLESDQIPRHDPGCIDLLLLPVADDNGLLDEHLPQRLDRLPGLPLLGVAEESVQDDDDEDGGGVLWFADEERDHRGNDQDDDQDACKLAQEDLEARLPLLLAEDVCPVALEARLRLLSREAMRAGAERLFDLI